MYDRENAGMHGSDRFGLASEAALHGFASQTKPEILSCVSYRKAA